MIAPPLGPVSRRARHRQDRFARAFGGGPLFVRARLDRGGARRPRKSQVGTEKQCVDRTKKLALGTVLDQRSVPIVKRDSHDCR
jgi:hypothetical protein